MIPYLKFKVPPSNEVQNKFNDVNESFKNMQDEIKITNPLSASSKIGQMQKFFFRKFITSFVSMLERYIKRPLFFLEKTLNFFSYMSGKN